MTLSRVVSEIFNVEKYHNLEISVKGQPIKVAESGTTSIDWVCFPISVL